jgi:ribosomal protein L40E
MKCSTCGAPNPEGAQWCTICLTSFVKKEPPPLPSPSPAPAALDPVVREGEALTWRCSRCDSTNPIEVNSCPVCGASFFETFGPAETATKTIPANRDPRVAAALSMLPGAGHLYLGLIAEGVTRLIFAIWWWATAIFLKSSTPILVMVRIVYLLATLSLIALSALDAYRAATQPERQPIFSRTVIRASSLVLFTLLIVGMLVAGTVARR